ncbi:hypothetical protein C0992_010531 [Termitomyces sp. T32_za158]|nr:hypothetical protein C0992_010531 [Termitomyces sp. T32_za158]
MDYDIPYTTPEEDPFNARPIFLQPRRRRSSLLDKWIQEQQRPSDKGSPSSQNNGYSACPAALGVHNPSKTDVVTLDNYDIVDDEDIPATPDAPELFSTPSTTRLKRTPKLFHNHAPFSNFNPFRSASPAPPCLSDGPGSPRSSRLSFLPRESRHSMDSNVVKGRSTHHQHNRSRSLGGFVFSVSGSSDVATDITSTTAKMRPSILGHFATASASQASVPSDTVYTPSRPSISSGDTYTSGTPTTESDIPTTPSRLNFIDSIRYRTKSSGVFASASAIFSSGSLSLKKSGSSEGHNNSLTAAFATQRSQLTRIPLAQKPTSKLARLNVGFLQDDDKDTHHATKPPVNQPDPTQPHVAYSSGATLPRVSLAALSARHKKKKKLVVQGVGPHEFRKFEGVKQWCEVSSIDNWFYKTASHSCDFQGFGEVSQIVRMPNGDLHVHFRLAEVADTVRVKHKFYEILQLTCSSGLPPAC